LNFGAKEDMLLVWCDLPSGKVMLSMLRLCLFKKIDLGESAKMDLGGFKWMNMCVFLSGFRA